MENKLQHTLAETAKDLYYPSESDYPFAYFEWDVAKETALDEKLVLACTHKPAGTPCSIKTLDDFFSNVTEIKEWYGEEEKATVQGFVVLKQTLEKELSHIRVYRLGAVEIDAYIAGQTAEGKWAGLQTKVVET